LAVNLTLLAFAADHRAAVRRACVASAVQQLIDIAYLLGPQQQSCCAVVRWDKQTDLWTPFTNVYYTSSVSKCNKNTC